MGAVPEQLSLVPALDRHDLLADPVAAALRALADRVPAGADGHHTQVAPIDASAADTAAFCERYGVAPGESANCVVVVGRREGQERYAACVVLATTRADVNGVVRRLLGVRKASFAAMDTAVQLTGMEYGGITPVGLPAEWPVYVDAAVATSPSVVVGSGLRRSKLRVGGGLLTALPSAHVVEGLGRTTGTDVEDRP